MMGQRSVVGAFRRRPKRTHSGRLSNRMKRGAEFRKLRFKRRIAQYRLGPGGSNVELQVDPRLAAAVGGVDRDLHRTCQTENPYGQCVDSSFVAPVKPSRDDLVAPD